MNKSPITAKLLAGVAPPQPSETGPKEVQPDTEQRILESIKKASNKRLLKDQKLTRERDKAIVSNLPNVLRVLEGDLLRDFFAGLECSATASQRKFIETHPLRPDSVTEVVAEFDAARAKATEAAKAQRAAERQAKDREEFERLKQKFGAGDDKPVAKQKPEG